MWFTQMTLQPGSRMGFGKGVCNTPPEGINLKLQRLSGSSPFPFPTIFLPDHIPARTSKRNRRRELCGAAQRGKEQRALTWEQFGDLLLAAHEGPGVGAAVGCERHGVGVQPWHGPVPGHGVPARGTNRQGAAQEAVLNSLSQPSPPLSPSRFDPNTHTFPGELLGSPMTQLCFSL